MFMRLFRIAPEMTGRLREVRCHRGGLRSVAKVCTSPARAARRMFFCLTIFFIDSIQKTNRDEVSVAIKGRIENNGNQKGCKEGEEGFEEEALANPSTVRRGDAKTSPLVFWESVLTRRKK
ncbi:MAG TPA: hypothetical protein VL240_08630 [Candidatus Binatia bacterium]|nr:hypothetical protein [Candidatus Binatia bacterium]